MAEMSPLAKFLMGILRTGSWGAAGLLVIFAAILVWQRWTPEGLALSRQDYTFLGILAAMVCVAIYLVRAIGRELGR
jgi:hypothetical protein